MAIPDTLQAWREYVADAPVEPERLTPTNSPPSPPPEGRARRPAGRVHRDHRRAARWPGDHSRSTSTCPFGDVAAQVTRWLRAAAAAATAAPTSMRAAKVGPPVWAP